MSRRRKRDASRQSDDDKDAMTLKETVKEIFDDIDDLKGVVAAMKHPTGAKDNPGRTCHDIHLGHPQLADGSFRLYTSVSSHPH